MKRTLLVASRLTVMSRAIIAPCFCRQWQSIVMNGPKPLQFPEGLDPAKSMCL